MRYSWTVNLVKLIRHKSSILPIPSVEKTSVVENNLPRQHDMVSVATRCCQSFTSPSDFLTSPFYNTNLPRNNLRIIDRKTSAALPRFQLHNQKSQTGSAVHQKPPQTQYSKLPNSTLRRIKHPSHHQHHKPSPTKNAKMKKTSAIILILFLLVVVLSVCSWFFWTTMLAKDVEKLKEEVIGLQARRREDALLEEGRKEEEKR